MKIKWSGLTVEVTFKKCLASDSNWKCNPTTAAGALCALDSTNTACVASTNGGLPLKSSASEPSRNGTENTKLSGSIAWCSTARLYHSESNAREYFSLKCLKI